jgi:hypothetical protein
VAKRKILTIVGRTNSCIILKAITEESAQQYAESLVEELGIDERAQVKTVRTDNPNHKQWKELSKVLPNLKLISEDTVHISMTYEQCYYKTKSEGSKTLRAIMDKFNKVIPNCPATTYGPIYTGLTPPELTNNEETMRRLIFSGVGIDKELAVCQLKETDYNVPMTTTSDFISLILAFVSVFKEEVKRISHVKGFGGAGQSIRKLLYNLTKPSRTQWLLNNTRLRAMVKPQHLPLLPKGSCGNEALHHNLNHRFVNQKELHLATLELQLELFWAAHGLQHDCAWFTPNLTQIRPRAVLARCLANVGFTDDSWAVHVKASLFLAFSVLRGETRTKVAAVRKRPATNKQLKRTKFNRKRVSVLKRVVSKPREYIDKCGSLGRLMGKRVR